MLDRISIEFAYVKNRIVFISIKVLFVAYVAQVPFRNIAYYRHVPNETLKDLGFEIIPEMNEDNKWISELVFILLHIFGTLFILIAWLSPFPHSNKVYGVVLAEQWLNCLCIGHTFRFLTYASTNLPGPATHCRPGSSYLNNRPVDMHAIFTRKPNGDDPNCGDLIFSGHVFQNIILCLIVTTYANKTISNFYIASIYIGVMWMLEVVQLPLIIAARNHYSVDLVVATYLAPLVWFFLEHKTKTIVEQDSMLINYAL